MPVLWSGYSKCAAANGFTEFNCLMVLPNAQAVLTFHFPLVKSQGSAAQGILPQCFLLLICHLEREEKESLRFSVIIPGASSGGTQSYDRRP